MSALAQRLWDASLSSLQDAETGTTDGYGLWSALFLHDCAILHQNDRGNVWVDTYPDKDKAHAAWSHVVADFRDWEER